MSKQGSESELARSTQCKKLPRMHTFKRWHYTPTERHSTAWLHPTLPSRALAKPRHSPHLFLSLHRAALAALAHTLGECSSSGPRLCYSTPFGTRSHTRKETYFAPPITVPMEHASKEQGSCTLVVCVTQPCSHLSQHGLCVLLCLSSHQRWKSHQQSNMTMPPLQQYQDIHPTCRW